MSILNFILTIYYEYQTTNLNSDLSIEPHHINPQKIEAQVLTLETLSLYFSIPF